MNGWIEQKKREYGFKRARRLSGLEAPAFASCAAGCNDAEARRLNEASVDVNANFMKTINKKYPLVKFKPQVDSEGNQLDTLIVKQQVREVDSDGKTQTREIILTADDLNQQDGQTQYFVPQENTIQVDWYWLNLEDREIEKIDMDVSTVSLPEIERINSMLLEQGEQYATPIEVSAPAMPKKHYIHTTSIFVMLYDHLSIVLILGGLVFLTVKGVYQLSERISEDEDIGIKLKSQKYMQYEDAEQEITDKIN